MNPVIQVGKIMLSISDLFTLYEVLRKKHFNEWSGSTICAQLAHCLLSWTFGLPSFPTFPNHLKPRFPAGVVARSPHFQLHVFSRCQHGAIGGRPRLQDFYGLQGIPWTKWWKWHSKPSVVGGSNFWNILMRYFEIFWDTQIKKLKIVSHNRGLFDDFWDLKFSHQPLHQLLRPGVAIFFRAKHIALETGASGCVLHAAEDARYPKRWPCTARRLVRETNGEFKANWNDFKDVNKQLEHACRWWSNDVKWIYIWYILKTFHFILIFFTSSCPKYLVPPVSSDGFLCRLHPTFSSSTS